MSEQARQQLTRTVMGALMTAEAEKRADKHQANGWLLEGAVWQYCHACERICYPAQPLCPQCLSDQLDWRQLAGSGTLLSFTNLHISFNDLFRGQGTWPIGLIAHESGPNCYAFLEQDFTEIGGNAALFTASDSVGQSVIIAVKPGDHATERAAILADKIATLEP